MLEIVDVAPRDGLQNAPRSFAPAVRAELCERLFAAGVRRIEAVSFVNSERVPQMAGAEEVIAALSDPVLAVAEGLVLNERGLERLLAADLRRARIAFGVSEPFNQRNAGVSAAEGLQATVRMIEQAHDAGIWAGACLATALGCPFAGEVAPEVALEAGRRVAEAGADEVVFADTIGVAGPRDVRALVEPAMQWGVPIGIHLHNTRNTGYANALAAVEAGASVVDAAVGGLGGCPFAPGATGNIATEDLVYLLDRDGIEHTAKLQALLEVARWLADVTEFELPGQLHRVPAFPPPAAEPAGATSR
ncbi:MAG: hydroxymethylglutaryl-CoA lyase [Solirubrobacteraceae bacterium]